MGTRHLNILYDNVRNGTAEFSELYAATAKHREINKARMRRSGGDDADALTAFDDTLLTLYLADEPPEDFERALNRRLRLRCIDRNRLLTRKLRREESIETAGGKDDDGTAIPFEVPDESAKFKEILEADHRQVIDSLIRDGNPDATTTAIVTAIMFAPPSATRNEIAKSIGVHHEVFKRQLSKLARSYDERRFGDYRDYLAV